MSKENRAAADYVAAMSFELAKLAHQHGLDTAGYMLEMAAVEAASWKPDDVDRRRLRILATSAGSA